MSAAVLSESTLPNKLLLKQAADQYRRSLYLRAAVLSESTLPYEFLLKKAADQCSERPAADDDSTAETDTPCSASVIESVASTLPTRSNTVILHNVSHCGPHVGPHADMMEGLIHQTRDLSQLVFDEDCLKDVTKKTKWKLALLVTDDFSTLCGFAITRITNGALSLAKIAVPIELRGFGFGKLMMEDAIKAVKKQTDVYEVCLSSLSTAVTFYQRIGFKAQKGVKVKTDFEVVEGQVYMTKKLRPRPKGSRNHF